MCSPARFDCCHIWWKIKDIGEFTTNANFTKACLCKKRLLERHTTDEAKRIAFDPSSSDDPNSNIVVSVAERKIHPFLKNWLKA